MSAQIATLYVWAAWAVSWFAAATWSTPAAKRPGMGQELLYRLVTVVGAAMLFGSRSRAFVERDQHWIFGADADWVLFALVVLSFAFTWWARIQLGALWSGSVTRKADHRVIDSGPYAIVRHPIYTGIIGAAAATAAQKDTVIAAAGVAILSLGFWIKARLEEQFLRKELGAEEYDSYRRRVPMLLPFGPKSA